MNTFETITLLLMCAAWIGLIYLVHRMIQSQLYIELLLNDTWNEVETTKVMLASLRQDLSLDQENVDNRFEEVKRLIVAQSTTVRSDIGFEGARTRERIAQVKTRLADEESDDQKAKAKARRKTHPKV